jgi:NAD(P)-dependent dehydrogenase (short-subunit alcohol dehydrogenase family)
VSGGIGRALAVGFCEGGSTVVGLGRNETNMRETARLCSRGTMDSIVGSVASKDDVDRLFDHALGRYGKVDVLINNAAVYPKGLLVEMDVREWMEVLEINVLGIVRCCRRALPAMIERKYGRIINMGSFAGDGPGSGSSAYSVSKAAVRSLTKALAAEVDRDLYPNVIVNELVPGAVKTSMSAIGKEPESVYAYARRVVDLPQGGPTGRIFSKGELHHTEHGIKARIKRKLARLQGKMWT